MKRSSRRAVVTVAAAGSALALAGGIAFATIPDDGKVFTACMFKNAGTIRLIDKSLAAANLMSHCTSLETEVSWNQKGEPGIQGIQGPAGKDGAPGKDGKDGAESGPAFSRATAQAVALPSNGSVSVFQLGVDAGAYVFTASVSVIASGASDAFCYLLDYGAAQEVSPTVEGTVPLGPSNGFVSGSTTLNVVAAHQFAEATTVSLQCGAPAASQFSPTATASLVAVKVRSIN